MPTALRARIVFPVDQPAVEHGIVTIGDDGRILSVGTQTTDAPCHDLGDVALLPGLVNTHTHLEFSDLREPLGPPGLPMAEWIRQVLVQRRRRSGRPTAAIAAGLAESCSRGTTLVGEIATDGSPLYADLAGPELTLFAEVIGFSQARADSAHRAAVEQLEMLQTASTQRAGNREQGASYSPRLGISPHAPYTVSPELLTSLVELAVARDLPVAMHVAESAEELELLAAGTGALRELLEERSMWDAAVIPHGSRPLEYLHRLARAPRALVIHGNYLSPAEHDFLAAYADSMTLVYCPRTHTRFNHPSYPLAKLLEHGVRVALGTDSRASNPDLCVLSEMRHVARCHPAVSPEAILRMGTLSGAVALGRDALSGSMAPGKWADLVAVELLDVAGGTPDELLTTLLFADNGPAAVWQRGVAIASPS